MLSNEAGTLRIEVDLSGVIANRREELARALTQAGGGDQANVSGVIVDAEVRGDLLAFLVRFNEDVIIDALDGGVVGRSALATIADEFDLHEDCYTSDAVDEAKEEAREDADQKFDLKFARFIDHLHELEDPAALVEAVGSIANFDGIEGAMTHLGIVVE